jgi:hypothetical protein
MKPENKDSKKLDLKKVFNLNNILSQIINWAAYIIAIVSGAILLYVSFVNSFDLHFDLKTITIFSIVVVALVWINWNAFYRRQYEKVMGRDIAQLDENKYSIHGRYYIAIKDYTDEQLQECIDKYNSEYEKRWLTWVEKYTGFPIETQKVKEVDSEGKDILDENGQIKTTTVLGIKDLPYKGFKHKILMWRIKTHHYPQSGYKTSTELSSLLSFRDSDLSKKNLRSDKHYYTRKAISKFVVTFLTVCLGASLAPQLINGEYAAAIFKLIIALGSLFGAIISGALSGVKGARLKLNTVEEVCFDLERWANKKPILTPYKIPEIKKDSIELKKSDLPLTPAEVAENIFNSQNLPNK